MRWRHWLGRRAMRRAICLRRHSSVCDGAFPELDLAKVPEDNLAAMGRIFGEELPSGLVFS